MFRKNAKSWMFLSFAILGFLSFTQREMTAEQNLGWKFWNVSEAKFESVDIFLQTVESYEIIVWGEEHDDSDGHQKQLQVFRILTETYPMSLSLEMLERDQCPLTEEFLSGKIPEKQFLSSTVHWKNFAEDYLPMVRIAKESYSPVVCANAPRRYVNAISRKGMMSYMDFNDAVMKWIPEAYTLSQNVEPNYQDRLRSMFANAAHGSGSENMLLAQFLWDQTMAESISREIFRSGRKVFQVNGRFHSDFGGGLVHRLRKMGHKVLVISAFSGTIPPATETPSIADFVISTSSR